jgi:hypothetical protein
MAETPLPGQPQTAGQEDVKTVSANICYLSMPSPDMHIPVYRESDSITQYQYYQPESLLLLSQSTIVKEVIDIERNHNNRRGQIKPAEGKVG